MSINWEIMEKIWRKLNPQSFKKSPFWDFKPYELKELNQDKNIEEPLIFWEIVEEVYVWDSLLGELSKLQAWTEEKINEYEGQDVRLEVYTSYTSYPQTEETYCLIRKVKETEANRQSRVTLYQEEMGKILAQEKEKEEAARQKQEHQDEIEYARLKEKFKNRDNV